MKRNLVILLCLASLSALAQVEVDRYIELVGASPADRQVLGLPASLEAADALAAGVAQAGTHRFVEPAPGAVWEAQISGLDGAPVPGTQLMLRVPANATANNTLLVNGQGPYPITLGGSAPLDSTLTAPGTLLSVVFDGNTFQVMNGPVRTLQACPAEMVEAFGSYCIDRSESPSQNFLDASLACAQAGKRMCSWGEFHAACAERDALGMVGMIGNWEWTNSTADSNFFVRTAGGSDCETVQRVNGTMNNRTYRCCFTR